MIISLFLLAALQFSGAGKFVPGQGGLDGAAQNAPTISSLTANPSANTVVLEWTSSLASTSQAWCGSEAAQDNTITVSVTSHEVIVAGLTPSTGYTCMVRSGNTTATVSATTAALASTTPITGLTVGSPTDSSPSLVADTNYNAVASDGNTYFIMDDVAHSGEGCGGATYEVAVSLNKLTAASPVTCTLVNTLGAYGSCCTANTPTGRSPKGQGLFSMGGVLYMNIAWQTQEANVQQYQAFGSIISSPDHGLTWNNPQQYSIYSPFGHLTTPAGLNYITGQNNVSPPFNFSANSFVMCGADDGTLGYLVAVNRQNDCDAYVYIISAGIGSGTGSSWNNDDAYYLARIPRSHLAVRLSGADAQFYTGGDGNLDSNWSSSMSAATAIISNTASLGLASVQYIPTLNRWLLLTGYYPSLSNTAVTTWLGYESPTPWGTWTQIYSGSQSGNYGPVTLQSSALAATFSSTSITVLAAQNYSTSELIYSVPVTVSH